MPIESKETTYKSLIGQERPEWAEQGEGVYEILSGPATGRIVVVRMTRKARDMDGDGIEDTFHAETVGRMALLDTGETLVIGTRSIETDPWVDSQTFKGDGSDVDLAGWVVSSHENSIFRTIRREQAALQIESISGLIVV